MPQFPYLHDNSSADLIGLLKGITELWHIKCLAKWLLKWFINVRCCYCYLKEPPGCRPLVTCLEKLLALGEKWFEPAWTRAATGNRQACLRALGPSLSSQWGGSIPMIVLKMPVKLIPCKFLAFGLFKQICGNVLEQNSLCLFPLKFEQSSITEGIDWQFLRASS